MSEIRLQDNMRHTDSSLFSADEEVHLAEIGRVIWQAKWFIVGITLIFSIAAVGYSLTIENEYKATAILASSSTSSSSTMSRLAGQFGGLASLAGVNLGGSPAADKTVIAMELIKTWGFLEDFVKNNRLEVEVYAAQGWDKRNNKLVIDSSLYNEASSEWLVEGKPTSWELFGKIQERISIIQDKESGLISLSVEHYSPYVAKNWVDLLVVAINEHIQSQDKKEAVRSIAYLKEQVHKTSIAEMQSIFYQLIEEQAKTLMLAEISKEYVLKTLSPAKVPEVKSKPKRLLIVGTGIVMGGVLAMMIVMIRYFMSKTNP